MMIQTVAAGEKRQPSHGRSRGQWREETREMKLPYTCKRGEEMLLFGGLLCAEKTVKKKKEKRPLTRLSTCTGTCSISPRLLSPAISIAFGPITSRYRPLGWTCIGRPHILGWKDEKEGSRALQRESRSFLLLGCDLVSIGYLACSRCGGVHAPTVLSS